LCSNDLLVLPIVADSRRHNRLRRTVAIISSLIIQTDGLVVPVQYGFADLYALGNLYKSGLRAMAAEWRQRVLPQFNQLCRVYAENVNREGLPFFNWYELIAHEATLEAETVAAS
jgi:hypothetical protein